ncbi:MAG: hypothetical protein LBJ03_03870 [Holosporales bacterium]|nr:hypothetical protein [Holosporales bacterium]
MYNKIIALCIDVFKRKWSEIRCKYFYPPPPPPSSVDHFKLCASLEQRVTRKRKDLIRDQLIVFEDLSNEQKACSVDYGPMIFGQIIQQF